MLRTLKRLAARTHHLHPRDPIPGLSAADESAALHFTSAAAAPPSTAENNFLLYWLLMATPWPASVANHADGPHQPVARAFGSLFDAVALPHTYLRNFASVWASWAEVELIRLKRVFVTALHDLAPP